MLITADDVLDAMGGNTKAANILDVVPHAVCMMRKRGIPAGHHLKIWFYLTDKGFTINTEEVFGYSLNTMQQRSKENIVD